MTKPVNLAVIGSGVKARQYIENWIDRNDVNILATADLDTQALDKVAAIAADKGVAAPAAFSDWRRMLDESTAIDSVYISSPHAFHAEQAVQCLAAGLDVLLEKPMVMTVAEAQQIIDAQAASGKTLVVAYQGGLSPLVHQLRRETQAGTYGELTSISATIWEEWATKYSGHWKHNPEISGGGFMFDTGAHMMNTVSMICASDFSHISAFMANRGRPVDVVTTAIGALTNGVLFTLHAAGETIPVCESRIELFFTEAIVRVCAWGRWLEVERPGKRIERFEQESAQNLINVFQQVREGAIENPSPATQGLKMAQLWDAVKQSASQGGTPVNCW